MVELSHIHNLSDVIVFQKWAMYTHKNTPQVDYALALGETII